MAMFNRKLNQVVRFATGEPADGTSPAQGAGDTTADTNVLVFTKEQSDAILDALALDETATPDEVVASITAITEELAKRIKSEQGSGEGEEKVAASLAPPTIIDARVWKDMQRAIKRGMTAQTQELRLAAEQVVDQAIRLGKASPTRRESWIAAYEADPEATVHRLNSGKEIPRMEIGYGLDTTADEEKGPAGWVR